MERAKIWKIIRENKRREKALAEWSDIIKVRVAKENAYHKHTESTLKSPFTLIKCIQTIIQMFLYLSNPLMSFKSL